jgi:hypothetical protein
MPSVLYSDIHGTAMRCAAERRNLAESKLRELADGRDHVLAELAGIPAIACATSFSCKRTLRWPTSWMTSGWACGLGPHSANGAYAVLMAVIGDSGPGF